MSTIKHIIVVLSGKGGVGKSTVACQLALSLSLSGYHVGVLDVDLCGPSVPKILGLEGKGIHQSSQGWVPVYTDDTKRLAVVSMGFLVSDANAAVIWRGPKKNATIKQFIDDVCWGTLDYLIVDTPPGTSDEHLSTLEHLATYPLDGGILVTTPQLVSLGDVRREITFCRKLKLPIIGLFENMSGYVCPHCADCTNIFSSGGGEALCKQMDIPFLGRIPIDPLLTSSEEKGESFLKNFPASSTLRALQEFVSSHTSPQQSEQSDESRKNE